MASLGLHPALTSHQLLLVIDSDHQPQPPSPGVCDSKSDSDDELCLALTPRISASADVVVPTIQEHPPRAQTPPPALDVVPPVTPPVPQRRRSRRLAEENN